MWIYPFEGEEGKNGESGENGEEGDGEQEEGMFMFDSGEEEFLIEYRQKGGRMVHKVC